MAAVEKLHTHDTEVDNYLERSRDHRVNDQGRQVNLDSIRTELDSEGWLKRLNAYRRRIREENSNDLPLRIPAWVGSTIAENLGIPCLVFDPVTDLVTSPMNPHARYVSIKQRLIDGPGVEKYLAVDLAIHTSNGSFNIIIPSQDQLEQHDVRIRAIHVIPFTPIRQVVYAGVAV